jgi:hypothetical protein
VGGARWHNAQYEGPVDTVFGGFYRREVFDKIGLFDESLIRNQDDELNLRLTRAGGKIWQSPKIKSWYRPRSNLASLFQQYMQYGYWKVAVMQKHRRLASMRQIVPAVFVFAVTALPLLALFHPPFFFFWLGVMGGYTACNVGASFMAAKRRGWTCLPNLPVVFACYHVGYGIGFLRGMLDFVILRRAPSKFFCTLTRSPDLRRASMKGEKISNA